ncbi:MAG: prepilin-type N-terminal cleavage/methylation domain-containing protein [Chloroflexi bacterium]|nr:prepilin-type N-terminal cleavage/methylation domain-containing protein [Chloroflexota bacterium]
MNKLKFKRNETGMTLPEALIALAIFAIVGVTFVSALGTNFKVLLMTDQRTTAESLAKTQLEAINNAPYDFTPPYEYSKITLPYGYDIQPNGSDINHIAVVLIDPETGAVSGTDLGVQKVTCNVTCLWQSPPWGSVIVVESYKR